MSEVHDCDVLILGAGSAAFAAGLKATELGARVVMVESREIGGTCVNRGCVPSKTMIRAAEIYHLAGRHPFAGIRTRQEGVDFAELASHKDQLVHALRRHKYINLAAGVDGITIIEGTARFVQQNTVQVDDQTLKAERILVATGARPALPPVAGLQDTAYLTSELLSSEENFDLKELPASLIIIGGGFIACELGQMFQRLGSRVTILQRGPQLLAGIDADIARTLCSILNDEGITTVCNAEVEAVSGDAGEVRVDATIAGKSERFTAQRLLVAAGVQPNTEHLHLAAAGVEVDESGLHSRYSRTGQDGDRIGNQTRSGRASRGPQCRRCYPRSSRRHPRRMDHRRTYRHNTRVPHNGRSHPHGCPDLRKGRGKTLLLCGVR